jgi:gluconolactonase
MIKHIKSLFRNRMHFFAVVGVLLSSNAAQAQLFEQDSVRLIARQFTFTEGPAVNAAGDVFFTDQPNNRIWKYSADKQLSLFMDHAGRANGMYFDKKGMLLACADENNELWSVDPSGKVKILVTEFQGKKLNGPNDLWVDPLGGIFLTDPYYQRDYWSRTGPEMDAQKVYYLPPGKKKHLQVAASNLIKPNGITGTPDGRFLYVADIEGNKTYRYNIGHGGKLTNPVVAANQGADGITLDEKGNLYLSGKGVSIYNSNGNLIGHIDIKEPWTANVCFGGKNRSDLFITAGTAIYTVPMNVKGVE